MQCVKVALSFFVVVVCMCELFILLACMPWLARHETYPYDYLVNLSEVISPYVPQLQNCACNSASYWSHIPMGFWDDVTKVNVTNGTFLVPLQWGANTSTNTFNQKLLLSDRKKLWHLSSSDLPQKAQTPQWGGKKVRMPLASGKVTFLNIVTVLSTGWKLTNPRAA